jgi:hypothetical protein
MRMKIELALLHPRMEAWKRCMDPLDEKLLRAWDLSSEDFTDAVEAELNALVPALSEAGYVRERPWGKDPDYFLWSFTAAGVERSKELEAMRGTSDEDS